MTLKFPAEETKNELIQQFFENIKGKCTSAWGIIHISPLGCELGTALLTLHSTGCWLVPNMLFLLPSGFFQRCIFQSTACRVSLVQRHRNCSHTKPSNCFIHVFRMYVVRTINITPAMAPLLQEAPQHEYPRAPTQTQTLQYHLEMIPPHPCFF